MPTHVTVAGTRQPIPRVIHNPGPRYADSQRSFGICSSIGRTPGGRLWCGFTSGGTGEGHLNYGIVVTSDNDGTTWSAPRIVFDTDREGPIRTDHVVIFPTPQGTLWILWNQYPQGLGGPASSLWAIHTHNPDEPTPTWSEPTKLVDQQNCLNSPTILSDHTWLLPTGTWQRHPNAASRPLISTDQGATWHLAGPIPRHPDSDFDEYQIVEANNNSLVLYNRHASSILKSTSNDHGYTWSEQTLTNIRHTNARFVFTRLTSGAWMLVKHGSLDWISTSRETAVPQNIGRSHLTAYISDDHGQTWQGGLLLDERPCSYPYAWINPDGRIYLSYERNRWHNPEILMATFQEADIRAATPTSSTTRLRILINQATAPT